MKGAKLKPAVCEKCGKELGLVPEDATDITCFACNELDYEQKRRRKKDWNNKG